MSREFENHRYQAFHEWLSTPVDVPFDMHAQDPEDWASLRSFIPSLSVSSAGGVLPFQAYGMMYDLPFYYRERDGIAELHVGESDNGTAVSQPLYTASEQVEECRQERDMWIDSLLNLVEHLVDAPFLWQFRGNLVLVQQGQCEIVSDNGVHIAWGHAPDEAYQALTSIAEEDSMMVREQINAQNINPQPINSDTRHYPEPEPSFTVYVPEVWRADNRRIHVPIVSSGS